MEKPTPQSKDIAVMLYIDSPESGDEFHEKHLKQFGFPRTRYPSATFYSDYHITIGYLKDIELDDLETLKEHLTTELTKEIDLEHLQFIFAMITLLGPAPGRPFIVALPENTEEFCQLNTLVAKSLLEFKDGKYILDTFTLTEHYLPHMNLYGQMHKNIAPKDMVTTLRSLQKELEGISLSLSHIKIR